MQQIQVKHVFTGDIIWQQINLFQSYNPLKYIDFELKISSVEMKCCVLIV